LFYLVFPRHWFTVNGFGSQNYFKIVEIKGGGKIQPGVHT